jgi:hypothetical protein
VGIRSFTELDAYLGKTVAIRGQIAHLKWGYVLDTDWTARSDRDVITLSEQGVDERFPDQVRAHPVEIVGIVTRVPAGTGPTLEFTPAYFSGYFIVNARVR